MVVAARGELSDSKVVKLRPVKVGDTTLINDGQMPGIPEDQGAPPCSSAGGGSPPRGGLGGRSPPEIFSGIAHGAFSIPPPFPPLSFLFFLSFSPLYLLKTSSLT